MRVDVLINSKAGFANDAVLQEKLKAALFRCDLHFHQPTTLAQTNQIIKETTQNECEYLVVCGGDGTLNTTLQPLIALRDQGLKIPALCVIPVGTANDLAHEMGISKKIERAAYSILNGGIKIVDVLEITSDGKSAYMVTNGGVGVPAQTADRANLVRQWIKSKALDEKLPNLLQSVFQVAKAVIEKTGSKIYEMALVHEIAQWDDQSWEVDIEVPGKTHFTTKAPFILVNNQPSVGGSFTPAPFTSNSDGTFNVLLIQPTKLLAQAKAVLGIRLGRIPNIGVCPSFETDLIKIKAKGASRPLTFFGDGEILHRNVRELTIRCLHPGIPLVTMGAP